MDIVEQKGYRIIQPLASGGEGQVFVCEKDSHRFIMKVMPCMDPRQREILSQIDTLASGFFPRVHEIFSDENHSYLIREYIEGNTLLMLAARDGHAELAGFLIKQRARVDARNAAGDTALALAALCRICRQCDRTLGGIDCMDSQL